jgi:hypothetical protein
VCYSVCVYLYMLGLLCVLQRPNPPSDIIIDPPPLTPSDRHNRPTNSSLYHGVFFPFPLSIPTLSLSLSLTAFLFRDGTSAVVSLHSLIDEKERERERETPSVKLRQFFIDRRCVCVPPFSPFGSVCVTPSI